MSTDEATPTNEEVRRDGQRVIVVNSQPSAGDDRPTRQLRSLGSVAAHATDPMSVDSRPRRRTGLGPLLTILMTAVPLVAGAWVITQLAGETAILGGTAVLGLVWLLGLAMAWRALGPRGREGRRTVWFSRAFGLVIGFFVAVYLLRDTVLPLI